MWAALSPLVLWLAAIAAYAYEDGMNLFQWMGRFSQVLERPFSIGWTPYTLKYMLVGLLLYGCGIALYYSSRENRRPGEEYGSAKWGNPKELNRKYMDHQHKDANIILTQRVRLGMDGYITQRNMNVLVVGGSGSGKTRFFCKPNIYSANCSYLITDPKGELLRAAGALLAAQGYEVRVFNLIDPSQSDGYNPFSYIHSEKDVLTLIDNLIKNTTPRNASSNDPFWEKAEIALDSALMLYLVSEAPPEEQNFEMVRIAPTYDYRRPLTLCVTNNTVRILRKLLVRLKDETVCIFINSTDTILGLIQTLKLEGRCKVFCADKSVRKLKQQNFTDVSDRLSELAGVNFFTSRFYSAVDIKLDYKPHVIVLTDVFHAPYSMIDPQTEVVQAIGRFRNGIEQAYHITNTCDRLQSVARQVVP